MRNFVFLVQRKFTGATNFKSLKFLVNFITPKVQAIATAKESIKLCMIRYFTSNTSSIRTTHEYYVVNIGGNLKRPIVVHTGLSLR